MPGGETDGQRGGILYGLPGALGVERQHRVRGVAQQGDHRCVTRLEHVAE